MWDFENVFLITMLTMLRRRRLALLLGIDADLPQPVRGGLWLPHERLPDHQPLLQPLRADEEGSDGQEFEALPPRSGKRRQRFG